MTSNIDVRVAPVMNDAHATHEQNLKLVECRLRQTYERLAGAEANVFLFSTLKSMNLATNDVTSFVTKQSTHKRVSKLPDLSVKRAAMKSKLLDALSFAKRLRQKRDLLRRRVLVKFSSRKSHARDVLSELVDHYHLVKNKHFLDARNKIEHIKVKDLHEKSIRNAPKETSEFLSHVNVFCEDQNNLKPLDPETPFLCSKDIILSKNELKLLARGPNFMIRENLDLKSFEIEVEKSVVKQKYNNLFTDKDDCSDSDVTGMRIDPGTCARTAVRDSESKSDKIKSEINEWEVNCDRIWEESSGSRSMIYNIKDKKLDLGNLRATNYKYNKSVYLPEAEKPDKETLHQFRRTEMMRIFSRALSNPKSKPPRSVAQNSRGFESNTPPPPKKMLILNLTLRRRSS